jgi:hypothetical protein
MPDPRSRAHERRTHPRHSHERRAAGEMFRFLGLHLAAGVLGGFAVGGALLWSDLGGIWTMMSRSDDVWVWTVLLFGSLIVTFGSVAMGVGVMGRAEERDSDRP